MRTKTTRNGYDIHIAKDPQTGTPVTFWDAGERREDWVDRIAVSSGTRSMFMIEKDDLRQVVEALGASVVPDGADALKRVEKALDSLRRRSYEMSVVGGESGIGSTTFSDGHYTGMIKGLDEAIKVLEGALKEPIVIDEATAIIAESIGQTVRGFTVMRPGARVEMRKFSGGVWIDASGNRYSEAEVLDAFRVVEVLA